MWWACKETSIQSFGGDWIMLIPTIVREIGESLEKRKKAKSIIDDSTDLSNKKQHEDIATLSSRYSDTDSIRLLDEGAILYENGSVRMFFEKGVIQKYVDSLDDDFVGYINLGHIDLWSLPLNLGTWTKKDLSIVELENGRQGLNVKPTLNKDLNIVKDLLAQEIPLSVSVEVMTNCDVPNSEAKGYYCADEIDIKGFSIVGNPANVSSSEVNLQIGEDNMSLKELLTGKKDEVIENENLEEITEEKVEELEVEDNKVELSENQVENLEKIMSEFEELKAENERLKAEIESIKAQHEQEKLEEKEKAKEQFNARTEEVLNKLEQLMNANTKKEEPKQGYLGSLESKGEK